MNEGRISVITDVNRQYVLAYLSSMNTVAANASQVANGLREAATTLSRRADDMEYKSRDAKRDLISVLIASGNVLTGQFAAWAEQQPLSWLIDWAKVAPVIRAPNSPSSPSASAGA